MKKRLHLRLQCTLHLSCFFWNYCACSCSHRDAMIPWKSGWRGREGERKEDLNEEPNIPIQPHIRTCTCMYMHYNCHTITLPCDIFWYGVVAYRLTVKLIKLSSHQAYTTRSSHKSPRHFHPTTSTVRDSHLHFTLFPLKRGRVSQPWMYIKCWHKGMSTVVNYKITQIKY